MYRQSHCGTDVFQHVWHFFLEEFKFNGLTKELRDNFVKFKFNGFTKDLRNNFAKQTQGAQTKSSAQMFFQHVLHIFLE